MILIFKLGLTFAFISFLILCAIGVIQWAMQEDIISDEYEETFARILVPTFVGFLILAVLMVIIWVFLLIW